MSKTKIPNKFLLLEGKSQDVLKNFPDNTFHTVVTSPPYWSLRDYFNEGQLGQEETPEEYIENVVAIMREVKRTLRKDGSVWFNIGDSYNNNSGFARAKKEWCRKGREGGSADKSSFKHPVIKTKDLVGMPWRVAFALQEDGWYLRCDIIWEKTNPMPDGAKDRPTKGHEYIFLLTKSPHYFYDYYRVLEDTDEHPTGEQGFGAKDQKGTFRMDQNRTFVHYGKRNKRAVWRNSVSTFQGDHFACVDEATECLTKRGWKKYFELEDGEDIASFDIVSETIKWTKLLNVSTYDYDGNLVEITKPSLNFLMTPNHRVVHMAYNGRARKYTGIRIKRADKLSSQDIIPIASDWESYESESKMTKHMSELLGWISSDGGYDRDNVKIYQSISANKEKVERIKFLLDHMEINYRYNVRKRFFISKTDNKNQERVDAVFSINSIDSKKIKNIMPDKKPTVAFMNESDEIIECFLNGFIFGDGHVRKDDGRRYIIQKDKDTMDILQMLCFKIGYSTNLKQRKDAKWVLYIRKNKFSGVRNTNGTEKAVKNIKYKGVVWCPSTKYTTFVARRNGSIMITGNTYPPSLITPCIQASTSERGCCAKCKTPWVRDFEKIEVERPAPIKGSVKKDSIEPGVNMFDENFDLDNSDTIPQTVKSLELIDKGWSKQCDCDTDETVPCLVLDPFNGTGTTGEVSLTNNQNYVGIELNPEYLKIARKRLRDGDFQNQEVESIKEIL